MLVILSVWSWLTPILVGIICLIVGAIIGFLIARKILGKYVEQSQQMEERQVRAMFKQMGRTPSEKQVRQVMQTMNANKPAKKNKK